MYKAPPGCRLGRSSSSSPSDADADIRPIFKLRIYNFGFESNQFLNKGYGLC